MDDGQSKVIQPAGSTQQVSCWAIVGGEVDETVEARSESLDRNNVSRDLYGPAQRCESAAEPRFDLQAEVFGQNSFEHAELRAGINFGI